jgi:protein-S-isoprenylcysteine O-methyltransferase Ste14
VRKTTAAADSAAFLVIAPGVVAGLVPWWLTRWHMGAAFPVPVRITGAVLIAAGATALLAAFAQFATQGRGTPAPPLPTEQLVVRGLYRYVRNPMYLAVVAVITGQALLLSRPVLLGYAAAVAAAFVAFVYGYEQPTLARRYDAQYEAYRRAVPGWWPRLPPARKNPPP